MRFCSKGRDDTDKKRHRTRAMRAEESGRPHGNRPMRPRETQESQHSQVQTRRKAMPLFNP